MQKRLSNALAYSSVLQHFFYTSVFALGKTCEKPLVRGTRFFPDRVFSGRYGPNYYLTRFAKTGWCPWSSTPYQILDLRKEFHITRIVVTTSKSQAKWNQSYVMKYGHDKTYQKSLKVLITQISRINSNSKLVHKL